MKKTVTNISSVGIIYRQTDPGQIFIEIKDDGHPIRLVRRQLCPIGGNWIGEAAKLDKNPLDTFRREFGEELSFERPLRSSLELNLMGMADTETFSPTPTSGHVISDDDNRVLKDVKQIVSDGCVPFGMFLNTVTKSAMDAVDQGNKREGFTTLSCYWAIPLNEEYWGRLVSLQDSFGNLSNESITMVTSLESIIRSNTKTSFAHDRVLQRFFLAFGLATAKKLPIVEGVESEYAGTALASYEDILELYDVAKQP